MKKNIDIIIGQKIKNRRISIGMTQASLASEVGVTFQQIQKYESGANSLNASRIEEIRQALKVQPSFFFVDDSYNTNISVSSKNSVNDVSEREILEVVKAFQRIKAPAIRKKIADLVRSMSDAE